MKIEKRISLIILFTILIIILLTNTTKAYFTDYYIASGEIPMSLGIPNAILVKREENNIKYFKVTNKGKVECGVRIKIFGIDLQENMIVIDENWEKRNDGYIYYKYPLNLEGSTTEISINYNGIKLIGVGEFCNCKYDEMGNMEFDWNYTIKM